ncbi:MAG: uroporphyrinogen decarboxylase family protein [Lachnospiraceae bacterium]|nr:uroporphyrinogen decarboxylase family protein [Lachnospiraceae bacterium]
MNSKERVMAAIQHKAVDRIPMFMDCTTSDVTEALIKASGCNTEEEMHERLHIDCRWCNCMDDFISDNVYKEGTSRDMWGIEKSLYGGIPVAHPLAGLERIEELDAYDHWPSPDQIDYDKYVNKMKQYGDYAVFGGMWSPFLEQASMLVGMEDFMMLMYDEPEVVDALLDRIVDFYLECNRRMFEKAGDHMQIFFMGDDYGTQNSLLYSPEMFRRFIKPRAKKLYDLAKSYGYVVQQHSCGSIVRIIPDLIDNGLDGLHPIQVSAAGMKLADLKEKYGKDLYFAGSMDAMHLLIDGTVEEIETAVKETMGLFDQGGFIFGPSQGFLPEIPPERIVMLYELGYKYGQKQNI